MSNTLALVADAFGTAETRAYDPRTMAVVGTIGGTPTVVGAGAPDSYDGTRWFATATLAGDTIRVVLAGISGENMRTFPGLGIVDTFEHAVETFDRSDVFGAADTMAAWCAGRYYE